jgi:predicted acetyltransferase
MSVELVFPSERHAAGFLAAEQERVAAGEFTADDAITAATLPAKLERWEANRHSTPGGLRVRATTLWLVDGAEYIGRISIRHELSNSLKLMGGHIGYDVRPSRRGQGFGGRMLALAKPYAKTLGVDPAMLTCDVTNEASWRMIERAGGTRTEEFVHDGIARYRYLLPTS